MMIETKSSICRPMFVLAVAIAISSCSSTREMVVECKFPTIFSPMQMPTGPALIAHEYGQNSPIPLNAVQFTSESLKRKLVVQTLNASRTETNTVRVYARLINCTDETMQLGIRTSFLGTSQNPTEPSSAWKTLIIQPATTGNYIESSMSHGPSHYLLEIRDDT